MSRFLVVSIWLLTVVCFAQKNQPQVYSPAEIQEQKAQGEALARQLRSAIPTENFESSGVLKITGKNGKRNVPVTWKVVRGETNWKTIYQTQPTAQSGAELLVITHRTDGPNEYSYAKAPSPSASLPEPSPAKGKDLLQPFGTSDFSLGDLGLEFLFWPQQRRLPGELRLNQDCYILESGDTNAAEIVRIKSFIDKKTFDQTENVGILAADAFDANSKTVKEFSLGGTSFKRVNGQWRVEKMEMQNRKTKSDTILKFDLPKD
jgi:hypothetical protein